MPVRYSSVGDGEAGFYVTGRDGYLADPIQRIHVYAEEMQELDLPKLTLKSRGVMDTAQIAIIVMCCLLVITALALSVSVVRLISVNRRRARQRSRRYPDRRRQRYR